MITLDTNKNYWLYIFPHVYCCIRDDEALLYNTLNGANIITDSQEIISILRSLHNRQNLGAVICKGNVLMQDTYRQFIVEFCSNDMGDVADLEKMPEKPVQLMPVLNLQRDVDRKHNRDELLLGENVLRYLTQLNIYLNSFCYQDCRFCDDYFRQNLCCQSSNSSKILNISTVKNILMQIRYGAAGKINLLGGNIFAYPFFDSLTMFLTEFKERTRVWIHYANFLNLEITIPDFHYEVPVTFPVKQKELEHTIDLLKDMQVKYRFFITKEEEYAETKSLAEKYEIVNFAIHPVYTKNNMAFFEEYVFTGAEDIFQPILSFRKIFAHQKLNTHFFGKLTIMPDGEIYANVNYPALGNISTDKLLNVISKELQFNTAWRKIRNTQPCSDCLYQYLCPSPSNYEAVIGKQNLCHIKK